MKMKHKFVDTIPENLDKKTLYISIKYATAVHKCMCGCGNEVVTPLSPQDWELTFNGESISLFPSIGNWSFPCKSHYWIKRNKVIQAYSWSDEMIIQNREKTRRDREKYLREKKTGLLKGLFRKRY